LTKNNILQFKVIYQTENLGEVLRGDRIVNTLYDVHVDVRQECTVLCQVPLDADTLKAFTEKIQKGYTVHLLADNLPIATKWNIEGKKQKMSSNAILRYI